MNTETKTSNATAECCSCKKKMKTPALVLSLGDGDLMVCGKCFNENYESWKVVMRSVLAKAKTNSI